MRTRPRWDDKPRDAKNPGNWEWGLEQLPLGAPEDGLPAPNRSLRPPELKANTVLFGHITLENAVHMTSTQGACWRCGGGGRRMERGDRVAI